MEYETALADKRKELDVIDREIVALYEARMRLSREIGALKRENGARIYDETRETAVLASRSAALGRFARRRAQSALPAFDGAFQGSSANGRSCIILSLRRFEHVI